MGEGDAFDFVFAEALLGAFGELTAKAGLVDAAAFDLGRGQNFIENGFLFFEGLFFHDFDGAGVVGAAEFFEEPHDGEVFVAADVDAEVEFRIGFVGRFCPFGAMCVFGGGDQIVGKEGGCFVGGDAHVFLVEGFFVDALALLEVEKVGFVHLLDGIVGWELVRWIL